MNRAEESQSGRQSHERDRFAVGLQTAAGLMMAHQIAGKAARDGIFLLHHGPQELPAMIAGAAAFSVALSLLNGGIMRRSSPRRVIPWAVGLSGLLQVAEWWLLRISPGQAAIVIYLHIVGVGAVLLSTFWSMLNEEFDPREAKRTFGRIAAGGTVGGLAGGILAERTVAWAGPQGLVLGLAGLHLFCGAFMALLLRNCAAVPVPYAAAATKAAAPWRRPSPLLVTLAAIVLLGATGAALLDFAFKVFATESWGRGPGLLRFFALFHTGAALSSFVLQSACSKAILERFGIGKAMLTLPATLAGGSFLALVAPGAATAGLARAAEMGVRGSIFRAAYETCYTPVPPDEKRAAKTFIDVGSERGGDAIGAAIVYLCLQLAGGAALPWILSIAAVLGVASVIVCRSLDRAYLKALARSLESHAVQLSFDGGMDLTTRSLIVRPPPVRAGITLQQPHRSSAGGDAAELSRHDPVLRQLNLLRSSDARTVHAALVACDVSDPLVAAQVCLLLGQDEHASRAQKTLLRTDGKSIGLLTDLMLDPTLDVTTRRRIPRIIGSAGGNRAAQALLSGLQDARFEVRMQCARALAKACAGKDRPALPTQTILAAVDRELAIGRVLWENHRQQRRDPGESGAEWLDDLLRDKAHGSLEYVFALLSLVRDRAPLMAAFRSLHAEDRRLRGTALEYLEGILPVKTREMLWEILQERPSGAAGRSRGEIMQELLNASETVVLRLRQDHDSPATQSASESPAKPGHPAG